MEELDQLNNALKKILQTQEKTTKACENIDMSSEKIFDLKSSLSGIKHRLNKLRNKK